LTFKLVRARDQTRLPCALGANQFSGSRDIWGTSETRHRASTQHSLTLRVRTMLSYREVEAVFVLKTYDKFQLTNQPTLVGWLVGI